MNPKRRAPYEKRTQTGKRIKARFERRPRKETTVAITFAQAKEIVYAAEQADWTVGTYMIEADGWEDATHYLVVRGAAEAMGDNPDPNFIIVPGLVPLVDKQTGEIEYVVAHTEWDRLDAMRPVSDSA